MTPYEISKLKPGDLLCEERKYYVIDYKTEKWLTIVAAESYDIKSGPRSFFFMTVQDLLTWRALADGTYTTTQIVTAIFGNLSAERLRKTREEADNVAIRNSILRGELLSRSLLTQAMEAIFTVIIQIIQASSLLPKEKKDLMDNIATWPIAIDNVSQKQSKQVQIKETDEA